MTQKYDVVMPILKRDWQAAEVNLPFVFENLPIKRLVVLSSPEIKELLPQRDDIVFVDENSLMPGLTISAVKQQIYSRIYTDKRAGWYFQQFLKMAYSFVCEDPAYVVWDADTVPVRPVCYRNNEGKYLFTLKNEHNVPYFSTIRNLLNLEKQLPESFIAENMVFDTELMRRLIAEIEANDRYEGETFWQKILNAVELQDLKGSGFSEFETYGTWVTAKYPERYTTRRLKTLRSGKNILGNAPSRQVLIWAGESFDTVSMEKFSVQTPLRFLAQNEKYRKTHSAEELDAFKGRFKVIPSVYTYLHRLWPRFKVWGGKYKQKIRSIRQGK